MVIVRIQMCRYRSVIYQNIHHFIDVIYHSRVDDVKET